MDHKPEPGAYDVCRRCGAGVSNHAAAPIQIETGVPLDRLEARGYEDGKALCGKYSREVIARYLDKTPLGDNDSYKRGFDRALAETLNV